MIKAIETQYKGYRFRSRLEARWAVFFDALGVKWEYEVEGFDLGDAGYYLPDFFLPDLPCWVEIKASEPNDDEQWKAMELSHQAEQLVVIQSGVPSAELSQGFWLTGQHCFMQLFGGYVTDIFPVPFAKFFEFCFSDEQWRSLAEFLSEQYGISVDYDGSPDERKRLVELDRMYFRKKYGREHRRWLCGRWLTGGGLAWDIDEAHKLRIGFPALGVRVAAAMQTARSARFEHGESPEVDA